MELILLIIVCREGCYEDLFKDVETYPAVVAEKRVCETGYIHCSFFLCLSLFTEYSRSAAEIAGAQKAIQKDTFLPQCWLHHRFWSSGPYMYYIFYTCMSIAQKEGMIECRLYVCSILWRWRIRMWIRFPLTGHESVGMDCSGGHFLVLYFNYGFCHRTKQVTRFHPPYVLEDVHLLAQHSEQLVANARQAWNEFLRYIYSNTHTNH